jgi:hypothetical protein
MHWRHGMRKPHVIRSEPISLVALKGCFGSQEREFFCRYAPIDVAALQSFRIGPWEPSRTAVS